MADYDSRWLLIDRPTEPEDAAPRSTPGGVSGRVRGRITTPLPPEPYGMPRYPAESYAPADAPPRPAVRPAPAPARRSRGLLLVALLLVGIVVGGVGGGLVAWALVQASPHPVPIVAMPTVAVAPATDPAHAGRAGDRAALTPPTAVAAAAAATHTAAPAAGATAPPAPPSTAGGAPPAAGPIAALYRQVAGSVVDIQVTINSGRRGSGSGEGSGIVVDTGHVLTNYHVVSGATSVRVVLLDGTSLDATVADSRQNDDLALLAVSLPPGKVQPATLGNSDAVEVGQEVIAIGSPFGLDHTLTEGIISAVNRNWSAGRNQAEQPMIQTDAPINPGNSGGPLFNLRGEVIGINTAIESPVEGSVGVGFAIPINRARVILP